MEEKKIAEAIDNLAHQLQYLGNGDANGMGTGAMEYLSVQIREAGEAIASSLTYLADTISERE